LVRQGFIVDMSGMGVDGRFRGLVTDDRSRGWPRAAPSLSLVPPTLACDYSAASPFQQRAQDYKLIRKVTAETRVRRRKRPEHQ
jgi:hypothetical protein